MNQGPQLRAVDSSESPPMDLILDRMRNVRQAIFQRIEQLNQANYRLEGPGAPRNTVDAGRSVPEMPGQPFLSEANDILSEIDSALDTLQFETIRTARLTDGKA